MTVYSRDISEYTGQAYINDCILPKHPVLRCVFYLCALKVVSIRLVGSPPSVVVYVLWRAVYNTEGSFPMVMVR